MPRQLRVAEGGLVYLAMNRSNARLAHFEDAADYEAFVGVLAELAIWSSVVM